MNLQTSSPLEDYLKPTPWIDFKHPEIQAWISDCPPVGHSQETVVRDTFEFVRDQVAHSWDIGSRRVTGKASEVLRHREGICYAKSHLPAALLRGLGIPSGQVLSEINAGRHAGKRLLRPCAQHRLSSFATGVGTLGRARQQAGRKRAVFDQNRAVGLCCAPRIRRERLRHQLC